MKKNVSGFAQIDPYRPVELPLAPPPGAPRRRHKPTSLTAIGVIFLVLGILSAIMWLFLIVGLLGGAEYFQSRRSFGDPTFDQAQDDFETEVAEIRARYQVVHILSAIVQLPLAAALIMAGIVLLRTPPRLRTFCRATAGAAAAFELAAAIPSVMMQWEHLLAANRMLDTLGGGQAIVATIARSSSIAGVVLFVVLFSARVVFYSWTLHVLGRSAGRDWFGDEGGEIVVARVAD